MNAPSAFRAALLLKVVANSSRNKSWTDKLCRWIVNREFDRPAEHDFMRDELIDNDVGFDPDELAAYQASDPNK